MCKFIILLLLAAQFKIVDGVIWECLSGRYDTCGKGLIAFNYEDYSGIRKVIMGIDGKWVIVPLAELERTNIPRN